MSASPPPPPSEEPTPGAAGDPWRQAERWFTDGLTPPEQVCAVCGARLDADQTYCLQCGSPTPLAPRLHRPSRVAAFAAGALAALVLGAAAVALASIDGDDDGTGATVVTAATATAPPVVTAPVFTTPPPLTTGTLPADTSGGVGTPPVDPSVTAPPPDPAFPTVTAPPTIPSAPPVTPTPPPVTQSPPPPGPAGRTAYTVILSSVRDAAEAQATAARVRAGGEDAGILISSEHPNLRPGYYVVFSGVYDSREVALSRAEDLRPLYPGAYAREVQS